MVYTYGLVCWLFALLRDSNFEVKDIDRQSGDAVGFSISYFMKFMK